MTPTILPQELSTITRTFAARLMSKIYAESLRNKQVGTATKTAATDWVDGFGRNIEY